MSGLILDQSAPHLIRIAAQGGDIIIEQDGNVIRFPMERAPAVASLILQYLDHYGMVETCK